MSESVFKEYLPTSVATNAAVSSGLLEKRKFSELAGLRGLNTKEARLFGAEKANSSGAKDIPRAVDTFLKSKEESPALFDAALFLLELVLSFTCLPLLGTTCLFVAVDKSSKTEINLEKKKKIKTLNLMCHKMSDINQKV